MSHRLPMPRAMSTRAVMTSAGLRFGPNGLSLLFLPFLRNARDCLPGPAWHFVKWSASRGGIAVNSSCSNLVDCRPGSVVRNACSDKAFGALSLRIDYISDLEVARVRRGTGGRSSTVMSPFRFLDPYRVGG